MKLKDAKVYEDWKSNNTDPYGAGIFRYAEKWAELMELVINDNLRVKDVAKTTSRNADTEGITGFMYGAAVHILSHCWEYGEELREWHNRDCNYHGEGLVNPAILTVKSK